MQKNVVKLNILCCFAMLNALKYVAFRLTVLRMLGCSRFKYCTKWLK